MPLAAKEETHVLPLAAFCPPQNSRPGLQLPNAIRTGPSASATHTSHPAWTNSTYESASDRLDQRYYNSTLGRFTTPDPYKASASTTSPQSWNRYPYVEGDPINFHDPEGLQSITVTAPMPPGPDPMEAVMRAYNLWYSTLQNQNDPLVLDGTGQYDPNRGSALGRSMRREVAEGRMTDCQALAAYAFDYASYVGSFQGNFDWRNNFVGQFGAFVDANNPLVSDYNSWVSQYGSFVGISQHIGAIPGAGLMLPVGAGQSGFQAQYQDNDPRVFDQVHHFAAFFQLGYSAGSAVGTAIAVWHERSSTFRNTGDIALGAAAAQLGAQLRAGEISMSGVANAIAGLCRPNP